MEKSPTPLAFLVFPIPLFPLPLLELVVVELGLAFFTYLSSQFSVSATTCMFDSRAA